VAGSWVEADESVCDGCGRERRSVVFSAARAVLDPKLPPALGLGLAFAGQLGEALREPPSVTAA